MENLKETLLEKGFNDEQINDTINQLNDYLLHEVMTFAEASKKWGLGESTLRSVVKTNRLIENVDYKKSGKVWLISKRAMIKLYGEPKK